jgi:hypothetical protein
MGAAAGRGPAGGRGASPPRGRDAPPRGTAPGGGTGPAGGAGVRGGTGVCGDTGACGSPDARGGCPPDQPGRSPRTAGCSPVRCRGPSVPRTLGCSPVRWRGPSAAPCLPSPWRGSPPCLGSPCRGSPPAVGVGGRAGPCIGMAFFSSVVRSCQPRGRCGDGWRGTGPDGRPRGATTSGGSGVVAGAGTAGGRPVRGCPEVGADGGAEVAGGTTGCAPVLPRTPRMETKRLPSP